MVGSCDVDLQAQISTATVPPQVWAQLIILEGLGVTSLGRQAGRQAERQAVMARML